MERYVDLHVHSYHSDGIHSPTDLVRMAAERGLAAIALADHDAVSGIDEALEAGSRHGVEVIPAIELSVEHGKYRDIHILGYFIDHKDRAFNERLADFREVRESRGMAIVQKINARLAGAKKECISYDEVRALAGGAVGRPHIGRVLIEKGYARDMEQAFRKYLIPCNAPKYYPPAGEAIAEIRRLGGVAVLAHPTTATDQRPALKKLIEELAALGLGGLEVLNSMCYKDEMLYLETLAARLDLTLTGGSDFHGFEDDVEIGIGRGGLAVAYRLVEDLKARTNRPQLAE